MSFIDDLKIIYQREKEKYIKKNPENDFMTLEEWMNFYGYSNH